MQRLLTARKAATFAVAAGVCLSLVAASAVDAAQSDTKKTAEQGLALLDCQLFQLRASITLLRSSLRRGIDEVSALATGNGIEDSRVETTRQRLVELSVRRAEDFLTGDSPATKAQSALSFAHTLFGKTFDTTTLASSEGLQTTLAELMVISVTIEMERDLLKYLQRSANSSNARRSIAVVSDGLTQDTTSFIATSKALRELLEYREAKLDLWSSNGVALTPALLGTRCEGRSSNFEGVWATNGGNIEIRGRRFRYVAQGTNGVVLHCGKPVGELSPGEDDDLIGSFSKKCTGATIAHGTVRLQLRDGVVFGSLCTSFGSGPVETPLNCSAFPLTQWRKVMD
jgi:hypothetical protein